MPLDREVVDWLAVGGAVLSLIALAIAALALRRVARLPVLARMPTSRRPTAAKPRPAATAPAGAAESPDGLDGLRSEVAALRLELSDALRHLAVVRYDAFGDMGGHLSWSLALLDDVGDGVVLTSIHGRSDSRTYAKNIRRWTCDQQLSPEEAEAIDFARADRAG